MKVCVDKGGVFPRMGKTSTNVAVSNWRDWPTEKLVEEIRTVEMTSTNRAAWHFELKRELYRRLYKGIEDVGGDGDELIHIVVNWEVPRWKSKDGRLTPIDKMELQHLMHSINKIIRQENWRKDWLPVLAQELDRRLNEQHPEADIFTRLEEVENKLVRFRSKELRARTPVVLDQIDDEPNTEDKLDKLLALGFDPKWEDDPT